MLARRHITSLPDPDLRAVLLALADTVDPSRWCPTIPQESALAGMESFLSTPGGGLGLLTGDHGTGKSRTCCWSYPASSPAHAMRQAGAAASTTGWRCSRTPSSRP
jgi:hypothetical protein